MIRKRRKYQDIEPDEILIDAQNLPGFDAGRLEGKIEKRIEKKTFYSLMVIFSLICVVFLGQSIRLQVVEAEVHKARAENNRLSESPIVAERGMITDRRGVPVALNEYDEERGFSLRIYPYQESLAHLVGYVSYPQRDQNGFWFQDTLRGVAGIELLLNAELAGENGTEIIETTARGEVVSGSVVRTPVGGREVALSIDAELQKELYEAIRTRVYESGFVGGSGVIMDVETGEVYALTSYPSFNPEIVSRGEPKEVVRAYVTDRNAPFVDRAVSGVYAPGSVVKPFVALGALEENIIDPEKEIYSAGFISIPNPYSPSQPSIFRDWKPHGWTDMREAIAVSSDVYFYAIGGGFEDQRGLGIAAIETYLRKFGFGEKTGILVEGEEEGTIPTPLWKARTFGGEQWFLGNTYHTAIGQYGFQATPLQLARATASLASGFLVEPVLFRHAVGKRSAPFHFKDENMKVVVEGMRDAVTEGTAQALILPSLSVAAKTGTAEVGARKEFINSLIIGLFPHERPRFAFVIVMERAESGTLIGAAATMRGVLEWIVAHRPEMVVVEGENVAH